MVWWEKQVSIRPDIIMGCYSYTITRKTNFYQPKQGYPPRMPDHIDFTGKNTNTIHSAPRYLGTRDSGAFLCPEIWDRAKAVKGQRPFVHINVRTVVYQHELIDILQFAWRPF